MPLTLGLTLKTRNKGKISLLSLYLKQHSLPSEMSILRLPIKLILIIAKDAYNINALVITGYHFYRMLNNKLYKRNSSSVIYWVAKFRQASTAQKAVLFVNINNLIKPCCWPQRKAIQILFAYYQNRARPLTR